VTPCPRCGGFKPLIENRWRTLCAECQAIIAHPLETLPLTAWNLVSATGRVWVDNAFWLVPFGLLASVPFVALRWLVLPWYVEMACGPLLGSALECVLLITLARRTFAWRAPLPGLFARYLMVLALNAFASVLSILGMLACFVGMLFVANFLYLLVPLALFDRRRFFGSIADSFRLSFRNYGRLLPASLLFGLPVLLGAVVEQILPPLTSRLPHLSSVFAGVRLGLPVFDAQTHVVNQVLELTVWCLLVERPRR
jgi:hypothetical protein